MSIALLESLVQKAQLVHNAEVQAVQTEEVSAEAGNVLDVWMLVRE